LERATFLFLISNFLFPIATMSRVAKFLSRRRCLRRFCPRRAALLFLAQPFLFFLFDSLHLLRRCLDKKRRQKVTHDISIVFFVFVNAPHFKAAEKWLQITAFAEAR
jgi:hypothetical protein